MTTFTTPVGRLVFGSVWDGSSTDSKGQTRIIKNGPNTGQTLTQWSFGVAFPKVLSNGAPNVEFNTCYNLVMDVARGAFPQFFTGPVDPITGKPGIPSGVTFATKIKDGDGYDTKGKPNFEKEGWRGHWVVVFSGSFAPRVFDLNVGLAPEQQLNDKTRVLPGDFVAVCGDVRPNTGETAGVYMNGNMVCFVGGGTRIVSGPKAADAFGGLSTANLPAGCVPGANPSTVVPTPPGVAPARVAPAPVAPAPVAPAAPTLTPAAIAAGFTTYQAAIAAGWTDDTLRAAGYLAAAAPTPPAAPVTPKPPVAPTPPAAVAGPQLNAAAVAAGFSTYQAAIENGWTEATLRASGYLA